MKFLTHFHEFLIIMILLKYFLFKLLSVPPCQYSICSRRMGSIPIVQNQDQEYRHSVWRKKINQFLCQFEHNAAKKDKILHRESYATNFIG